MILEESIADVLGVHVKDIDVVVDPVTGDVTYSISSIDELTASNVQTAFESPSVLTELNAEVSGYHPTMAVAAAVASEDIAMEILITIDASDAPVDLRVTNDEVLMALEEQGYSVNMESKND